MINYDYQSEDWGMLVVNEDGTKKPFDPDKVVIHWGGSGSASVGVEAEMARLRGWDRYHKVTKGWANGLAYNAAVGQSGKLYRGRGWNRSGAQSGDYEPDGIPENSEAFAIVWIGGAKSIPSAAAYDTMERAIRELALPKVIGHQEVKKGSTACPGPEWMQFIAEESWKWPQPSPIFADAWQWGLDNHILTRHSIPQRPLDYEHFIALLRRYHVNLGGE